MVAGSIQPSGYFFLKPAGTSIGKTATVNVARAMAARREAIEVNRRYLNGLADITSSLRGEALRTKFSNKSWDATFQGRRPYNVRTLFGR